MPSSSGCRRGGTSERTQRWCAEAAQAPRSSFPEVQTDLQALFLYSGKHRPEMYLAPRVGAGISTFAALADPAEAEAGCRKLPRDIATGRIAEVIAGYHHTQGDYLFVRGGKQGL